VPPKPQILLIYFAFAADLKYRILPNLNLTADEASYRYLNSFCSYDMTYLLTAIRLIPSGSSTVHIYTQTVHRTSTYSSVGTAARCGLWPVEQDPSIFPNLSPTLHHH
jgi:hypothetical protein